MDSPVNLSNCFQLDPADFIEMANGVPIRIGTFSLRRQSSELEISSTELANALAVKLCRNYQEMACRHEYGCMITAGRKSDSFPTNAGVGGGSLSDLCSCEPSPSRATVLATSSASCAFEAHAVAPLPVSFDDAWH